MDDRRTAVVVGAGLSGLAAGCFLASDGWRVRVLERSGRAGGRARSTDREGFAFNLGPHALYTGGAASEALSSLGVSYGRRHGPTRAELLRDGEFHALPASFGSLLTTSALGVADKVELLRLFAALPRIQPRTLSRCSVSQWLDEHTHRPRVRALLDASARTAVYAADLTTVSADLLVDKVQTSARSPIHYLDGGWQTLVDALAERARSLGVAIDCGDRVERLELKGPRVDAVSTAGGRLHPADAVVLAVAPHEAARLLPESLSSVVAGLVPARVATLDVALADLPNDRHLVVQDEQRPVFCSVQSAFAKVAPAGSAFVTSFKQLDPVHGPAAGDRADLESLLDDAQPGWRQRVRKAVFLPDLVASNALPTAATGGLAGRPATQVDGVDNVFLAGDWVGDTGFLADACFASAREAARLAHLQQPARRTTSGA